MYPNCNQNSQKLSTPKSGVYCEFCDYRASRKSDFRKHLMTAKHIRNCNQNVTKNSQKLSKKKYYCEICCKTYKSRMGMWRHNKQKHGYGKKDETNHENNIENGEKNYWQKRAKRAENKIVDLQKQTIKILEEKLNSVQTINNIQTQNNTQNISINVFLNHYCKDAMSLEDFVEKLSITLEENKKLDYVDNVSNLLINSLKQIPDIDKPIWSTDKKRNKFVVKGVDGWEKDDGTQVDCALQMVKYKQLKALTQWESEHPNFQNNPKELEEWQLFLEQMSDGVNLKQKQKNKKAIHKNLHNHINIKKAIDDIKT